MQNQITASSVTGVSPALWTQRGNNKAAGAQSARRTRFGENKKVDYIAGENAGRKQFMDESGCRLVGEQPMVVGY
jgi:hypothetical protein